MMMRNLSHFLTCKYNCLLIHGIIIGVTAGAKQIVPPTGADHANLLADKKVREYFVDSPGSEGRFITCMKAWFKGYIYDGDRTVMQVAASYEPGAKDEVK